MEGKIELRIVQYLFNKQDKSRKPGAMSLENARLLRALSSKGVGGCLQISKSWKKEDRPVIHIKHQRSCGLSISVTFAKTKGRDASYKAISKSDRRFTCPKQQVESQRFRWEERIREETAEIVENRWSSGSEMQPGCFIGLVAAEDPLEKVEVGGIDFNVITFAPKADGRITAIGSSDQDLKTSIVRSHIFCINKVGRLDTNENLEKFKKAGIVVDVVGEQGARGPSSGLGYVAGLISLALGEQFVGSNKIAFTGEVSANGDVSPVGGIVAKASAAKASGIRQMFLPAANKKELKYFKTGRNFKLIYVHHANEMLLQLFPITFKV